MICVGNGQLHQLNMGDRTGALNCMHDQQIVLVGGADTISNTEETMYVRRLTPEECELLQGFPENWTRIGKPRKTKNGIEYFYTDDNGKRKKVSDSARYRAIGNSICTPFWTWLMKRIGAQYERTPTLGSLFDGIGGFPYCWEKCNGKGTAIWSSEIDEFCTAVSKFHFPDESEVNKD